MNDLLKRPALVFSLIIGISAAALTSALTAQYVFGLEPCPLCLYQRVPYALAALLGLAGLILRGKNSFLIALICGLVFTTGGLIAFYHHGVEQHWWISFIKDCGSSLDSGQDLLAQIENAKAVRCDVIPWADPVFGWSMAAWNVPASIAFAAFSFAAAIRLRAQKA